MSWFGKILPSINSKGAKKDIPEGVWSKCESCRAIIYRNEFERDLYVCPKCNFHMYLKARKRLDNFLDPGSYEELAADVMPVDRIKFKDKRKYKDRLHDAQKVTKEKEALIVYFGRLMNIPVVACAFEYRFIGGSMGAAVGERFVRAVEAAMHHHVPLVCFTASGGARMQEALTSLFQMAKTSAALAKLAKKGLPYIAVLTNPTMGGVSASIGTLGDVIIAEPGALIGFSGPRVIEQTIRQSLPEGFQRSEFLLEHGALDMIVDRRQLRVRIANLLDKLMGSMNQGRLALPLIDEVEAPR